MSIVHYPLLASPSLLPLGKESKLSLHSLTRRLHYSLFIVHYSLFIEIVLTLALVPALTGCQRQAQAGQAAIYKTLTVGTSDRTLYSTYTARLAGRQMVDIRPQVSGLITRICIGEGEKVRRGQVLFIIDQVPYQAALREATAAVNSAQAALQTAQMNMESTRMLHDNGVVSDYELSLARNNLAGAEATLASAEAQEENARCQLSYTEVRSPVDGVAGMIAYRVGALVSSSIDDPLVTVADDSRIYAYFSMTESQVTRLVEQYGSVDALLEGMPDVTLQTAGGSTYGRTGRVTAVSRIVSSGTNAVTLRAEFDNPDGVLRDGGSGAVVIPTRLNDVIVIPQTATYELQDRTFAFRVGDDHRAESIPVEVYHLNDGAEYVVTAGLSVGETIIAEGAGLVREGALISTDDGR